jgi:phosphoribosyl 1,2-cyclic phosphodiesterase
MIKVRLWGVRGGVPVPGPDTVRLGGNTPCVEVRTGDNQIIILDAGTGIRPLGQALMEEFGDDRIVVTLLMSHTHWDHIQGFPFFNVHLRRKNRIVIIGEKREGRSLETVIADQFLTPYLPFEYRGLDAGLLIKEIRDQETLVIGEHTLVTARSGFHPGGVFIYRIEHHGRSIVYATDVGHPIGSLDERVLEMARDCDVLIHDAQFSDREKLLHPDWGHSTWKEAAQVGKDANAHVTVLFHYGARAKDDHLYDVVEKEAKAVNADTVLGYEGLEFTVD